MKKLIILLYAVMIALPVFSAEKTKLSINDAVSMAVEKNDTVRMEKEKVYAAQDIVRGTVAGFMPQLTASFDWKRYYERPVMDFDMSMLGDLLGPLYMDAVMRGVIPPSQIPSVGEMQIEAAKEFETTFGLTLAQPLFLGGKIGLATYSAGLAERTQKKVYETARNEIEYYVKVSYYNVLYTESVYKISRSSYYKALKSRDVMKERTSSGRMSKMDNIKMEADIAMKKPKMLEAKMNYEIALRNFKKLIGLEEGAEIELTDKMTEKFPDYNYEELKEKMMKNNSRIKIAENMVGLYESLLSIERSKYFPNIYGYASYQYMGGNDGDAFIGSENVNRIILMGVKAEYDLFTSGKRVFSNGKAEHDLKEKKIDLEKTVKDMEFELQKALKEYSMMRSTYKELITSVGLVKESYNAVYEMFESGLVTRNDLNDAEDNYDETIKSQKKVLMGINAAIAKIDKLTKEGDNK